MLFLGRCLAGIARSQLKEGGNADESRKLLHEALAAYDVAIFLGLDTAALRHKRDLVLALFKQVSFSVE